MRACSSSSPGVVRTSIPGSRGAPGLALAVALKGVGGPLARGREVEFTVRRRARRADESLAARMLPESLAHGGRPRRRDAQPVQVAFDAIAQGKQPAGGT